MGVEGVEEFIVEVYFIPETFGLTEKRCIIPNTLTFKNNLLKTFPFINTKIILNTFDV